MPVRRTGRETRNCTPPPYAERIGRGDSGKREMNGAGRHVSFNGGATARLQVIRPRYRLT
jgi:hypothetical protein